jgi:protein-S-isoprenylcysteine O-methyltransferase Ste14
MEAKVWFALGLECVIFAAFLFGGAGTLHWPAAWIFLALFFGCAVAVTLALARRDPALLAERMRPPAQKSQPLWDKVFLSGMAVGWFGWLWLMGADAARYHWSSVPVWLETLAAPVIVLAFWIIHRTFVVNTFAAPVVKVQREREHAVVTTGPYAIVRHPMYAGAIILIPAIAVLLGSWYGLAASLLILGGIVFRTAMEDSTLKHELPGYAAYAARVRYRLVPLIW